MNPYQSVNNLIAELTTFYGLKKSFSFTKTAILVSCSLLLIDRHQALAKDIKHTAHSLDSMIFEQYQHHSRRAPTLDELLEAQTRNFLSERLVFRGMDGSALTILPHSVSKGLGYDAKDISNSLYSNSHNINRLLDKIFTHSQWAKYLQDFTLWQNRYQMSLADITKFTQQLLHNSLYLNIDKLSFQVNELTNLTRVISIDQSKVQDQTQTIRTKDTSQGIQELPKQITEQMANDLHASFVEQEDTLNAKHLANMQASKISGKESLAKQVNHPKAISASQAQQQGKHQVISGLSSAPNSDYQLFNFRALTAEQISSIAEQLSNIELSYITQQLEDPLASLRQELEQQDNTVNKSRKIKLASKTSGRQTVGLDYKSTQLDSLSCQSLAAVEHNNFYSHMLTQGRQRHSIISAECLINNPGLLAFEAQLQQNIDKLNQLIGDSLFGQEFAQQIQLVESSSRPPLVRLQKMHEVLISQLMKLTQISKEISIRHAVQTYNSFIKPKQYNSVLTGIGIGELVYNHYNKVQNLLDSYQGTKQFTIKNFAQIHMTWNQINHYCFIRHEEKQVEVVGHELGTCKIPIAAEDQSSASDSEAIPNQDNKGRIRFSNFAP